MKVSGLWFEAQEELGIDLKDEGKDAPPIKVTQEEFNKLLEKGRIEEDDNGWLNDDDAEIEL